MALLSNGTSDGGFVPLIVELVKLLMSGHKAKSAGSLQYEIVVCERPSYALYVNLLAFYLNRYIMV